MKNISKLQQEVNAIISSSEKTINEKISALNTIKYDGRPGVKEAREKAQEFLYKVEKIKNKLKENSICKIKGFWRYAGGVCYGGYKTRIERGSYQYLIKDLKKEKFAAYIKKLSPDAHVAFREVGSPTSCKVEDHGQYRLKFLDVLNKIKAFKAETGLNYEIFANGQRPVDVCQSNGSIDQYGAKRYFCVAGGHIFVVRHDETKDWDFYGKNSKYPKVTVDSRYIQVYRKGDCVAKIGIPSFQGNYLINAISKYLGIKPIKMPRSLKPIQGNEFFDLEAIRQLGKTAIYRRTFGGETLDYCAVGGSENYHAPTIEDAVKGLRRKIAAAKKAWEAKERAENRMFTSKELHEEFGFCWTEMRAFCSLNGLDIEGQYTVKQIRNAALKNKSEACARWKYDLEKIGIFLNCK